GLDHADRMTARVGERVQLSAIGSSDPDQPKAWFDVTRNRVMPPGTGTMHIILAVTDHGTPRLTRYRRVIVDIVP
ncbi:MAG TPA: hypothetical protein VLN08_05840, partial [Vicinamibacterales bacterium]|nr:hypothetical protein [Vicinamibacterales bacterium]